MSNADAGVYEANLADPSEYGEALKRRPKISFIGFLTGGESEPFIAAAAGLQHALNQERVDADVELLIPKNFSGRMKFFEEEYQVGYKTLSVISKDFLDELSNTGSNELQANTGYIKGLNTIADPILDELIEYLETEKPEFVFVNIGMLPFIQPILVDKKIPYGTVDPYVAMDERVKDRPSFALRSIKGQSFYSGTHSMIRGMFDQFVGKSIRKKLANKGIDARDVKLDPREADVSVYLINETDDFVEDGKVVLAPEVVFPQIDLDDDLKNLVESRSDKPLIFSYMSDSKGTAGYTDTMAQMARDNPDITFVAVNRDGEEEDVPENLYYSTKPVNMEYMLRRASLIISNGGIGTSRAAAILDVPHKVYFSRGEQKQNALEAAEHGAMEPEKINDFNVKSLNKAIDELRQQWLLRPAAEVNQREIPDTRKRTEMIGHILLRKVGDILSQKGNR
jgi:hypothetical protein